jgi:hypothetical protein
LEEIGEMLVDSLASHFDIDSTTGSYSAQLPLQHYAGANFHFTKRTEVGALYYGYWLNGKLYSSLTLSGTAQLGHWLSFTANYTMGYQGFNVVGAGFSVRVWKLQWYLASDNILAPFRPENARYFQMQTGFILGAG